MKKHLLGVVFIGMFLTGCKSVSTTNRIVAENKINSKEKVEKNNKREALDGKSEYIERIPPIVPGISGVTIKWHGYIYESKNGTSVRSYPGGIVKDDLGNIVFPRLIKNED